MKHWFTAVTLFDRLSCSPGTQIYIYQLLCNVTETYVHLLQGGADRSLAQPGSKQGTATILGIYSMYSIRNGARGGLVVKALRYKPAGRGFDSRWCHWNFSLN